MTKSRMLVSAAVAVTLAFSAQALAQTQPDPHHPQQGGDATAAVATPKQTSGMMMPMGQMMQMMGQMMQSMGANQMDAAGMNMPQKGMADHFAGRVAFLHAELNVTGTEEKAWNDFVAALHGAAERLKSSDVPMMPGMANGGLPVRLDAQEKLLSTHLEGMRAVQSSLVALYGVLSEDQRKLADELLVGPMGFMGPGMMPGQQ